MKFKRAASQPFEFIYRIIAAKSQIQHFRDHICGTNNGPGRPITDPTIVNKDRYAMKRRQFLALSTLTLATSVATSPVWAGGSSQVEFTKEAYQKALNSGEPFMLDFAASW